MTLDNGSKQRLAFLVRVVEREARHLAVTTERLFDRPFGLERAARLEEDIALAERVDAFVSRFGRLQDTLGDKLIPALLTILGERPGAAIDNLDRAERLGWIPSADRWMEIRRYRNQMIHEYIEDPVVLVDALEAGKAFVATLLSAVSAIEKEIEARGLHGDQA